MPDDKYRKKNWKGTLISVVAIVVSLIVVVGCLLGGYIGYKNYTKNHKKKSTAAQQETQLSGQIESVQHDSTNNYADNSSSDDCSDTTCAASYGSIRSIGCIECIRWRSGTV